MEESGTVPPLQTESENEAAKSNHLITYMCTTFPRREAFEGLTYSYRLMSDNSLAEWIVTHDWSAVYLSEGSNAKAEAFQREVDHAMDKLFPIRTTRSLEWAMQEVSVKFNQFSGVKGCSSTHLTLNVRQKVLSNLKDRRAASILTSIDYAKVFNRLSFQHCLRIFAKRGASTPIIRLLATFLSNRSMTVQVGQSWSTPRPVTGGCPQGSILGVFLFNLMTDNLEDGCKNVVPSTRPDVGVVDGKEEDDFHAAKADDPEEAYSGYVRRIESPDPNDSFVSALSEQDKSFHSAEESLTEASGGLHGRDLSLDADGWSGRIH